MDKHDFKRLDIERAKINVSVQEARDLIAAAMGGAPEPEPELAFATVATPTTGLGYRPDAGPAPPTSKSLEKLRKMHKPRAAKSATQPPRPPAKAASSADPRQGADSDSDSDAPSRTSIKRQKRTKLSALDAYKQAKRKKKS